LRFRDVGSGKEVRQVPAVKEGDAGFRELRFSADGQRFLVYTHSEALSVRDVKTGKELRRVELGPQGTSPIALALSPDGKTVAFGKLYGDARVRVWDVESGTERLANAGHRGAATVSLSPDGRTLVSQDSQVFHWDLRTGDARGAPVDAREEVGQPSSTSAGWTVRGPRWRFTHRYQTS